MPEHSRFRRAVAALGVLLVAAALAAPAALAEPSIDEGPWTGSTFDAPFVAGTATKTAEQFPISGVFRRSGLPIQSVRMTFDLVTPEGGEPLDDSCVAPDIETLPDSDPSTPSSNSFEFDVDPSHFTWVCNGVFAIVATGTAASASNRTQELTATLNVEVPPIAVTEVAADAQGAPDASTGATDEDPETVSVTWKPLSASQVRADSVGYRVERRGPAADGPWTQVGEVQGLSVGEFEDLVAKPGDYRYRVTSIRASSEPGRALATPSEASANVAVAGPEGAGSSSTTTPGVTAPPTTQRLDLPSIGPGTNNPRATPPTISVPSPPTTLDTGFNDELDYGDRDIPEPGEELAGEGQSVIQTDTEGAGLLGPVAGAMVLLGWAGHVAYLNRLAKQF